MNQITPIEKKFILDCDGRTALLKVHWQGKELTLTQKYETRKDVGQARKEIEKVLHQMLALGELYQLGPSQSIVVKGKKVTRYDTSSNRAKTYNNIDRHLRDKLHRLKGTQFKKVSDLLCLCQQSTPSSPTSIHLSPATDDIKQIIAQLQEGSCKISNAEFLRIVETQYGTKRVESLCARYAIFAPRDSAKKLNGDHVRQLQIGLKDLTGRDLDKLLKKETLSIREMEALKKLGKAEQLKAYSSSSQLPAPLFNELVQALSDVVDPFPGEPLPLEKITGLPGKYFQHGWVSHRSGRSLEDEERLRLYEEIKALGPGDQARYCELLSKILVKKHLYYEKGDDLKMGMLIPAPKGIDGQPRWYRVDEIMDSGWGKFGYRMVPATTDYPAEMPDMVLYRSSATLPTAMDAFTSYLNDINIMPPGYLSRNRCKKQELKWLTEATATPEGTSRPLLVTGHSLGAANSQMALLNLQKSSKWPDRKISLELFDSPAIAAPDAKKFAKWVNGKEFNHPLTFNYYVSKGDPVPLAGSLFGSSYLGSGLSNKNASAVVHEMALTKQGEKTKIIEGLGPHGRLFLRGKKWVDFREKSVSIEQFNEKNKFRRVAVNLARVVGTALVWPTIGAAGGLKRLLVGRRHHDPVLKRLFFPNKKLAAVAELTATKMQQTFPTKIIEGGPINFDAVIDKASSRDVKVFLKFIISCQLTLKEVPWSLLKAVLIKKSPKMLAESRAVMQEIFKEFYKQVEKVPPGSKEDQYYEFLLGDLLTLYPFLEAHYEKNPTLTLPQKIEGKWQLVPFTVIPKRLSAAWMQPPVYAYALQSKNPKASALLLFAGTPPPTTTGEAISKWVDAIPGLGVGEYLYKMGAKKISRFVNQAYDRTQLPVKMYGKSLGGSLCLLTSVDHGSKVEANAYNPAGLSTRKYVQYQKNRLKWRSKAVQNVFSQKKDLVSELLGKWPKECNFYKIVPEEEVNPYFAHIQTFLAGKKVKVLKMDPVQLNKQMRRKVFRVVFHVAACALVIPNSIGLLWSSGKHHAANLFKRRKVQDMAKNP